MVKLIADLNESLNECKITWKYLATSQGKGVYCIGGSAKSLVRKRVTSRGVVVLVQVISFKRPKC